MSIWELLATKAGSTALVLFFFTLVIVFLRWLYGPGGRFRDPQWDKWNEEAKAKEEAKVQQRAVVTAAKKTDSKRAEAVAHERGEASNVEGKAAEASNDGATTVLDADSAALLGGHEARFMAYGRSFFTGIEDVDKNLTLKMDHTRRVVQNAVHIAAAEPAFADKDLCRALLFAALYHDVARFEQFKKYRTFADSLSCNHGSLGARILAREKFLAGEAREFRHIVRTAVCLHNRFAVPDGVTGDSRKALLAVRDADKLDVLKIMTQNLGPGKTPDPTILLHIKNEPGVYSPGVLQSLEQGRSASFRDLRSANDFRLLLCTWVFDLNYEASRIYLARAGYLDEIAAGLDGVPEVQERAAAAVLRTLEPYLAAS